MAPFRPTAATTSASATTSTTAAAQVTLPSPAQPTIQVRVYNGGDVPVFISFGNASMGAATTTASMPLASKSVEIFTLASDQTHHRVITASGSATVYFTAGEGR
jgi:hypothetical protein